MSKIRNNKGWSQFELGKRADITQGMISQIETGKIFPYPGWRRKLSEALKVDEEYLFPEINKNNE